MTRAASMWMALGVVAGVIGGLSLGGYHAPRLAAAGGDRWNERAVTTGVVSVQRDKGGAVWNEEALYVLNKSKGLLLAAVPDYKQSVNSMKILSDFAERDLVKDFGLEPGSNPHFLMTTLAIGTQGQGWSPLLVMETESGQVATYRVQIQATQGTNRPLFQLVDRRTDARLARSFGGTDPDAQH
jgi:hypothetical protein